MLDRTTMGATGPYAKKFLREIFPTQYQTGALKPERYSDPAFAQREWNEVFCKTWQVAGRTTEIPDAGDFITFELGKESFLIVRQEDGTIRAFYNVCQHRGNRLTRQHEGSQASFTCDYHSWRWSIDGSLEAVQDEEDFSQGSPCKNVKLEAVRCESFKSFIFINMDLDAVDLKTYLGPLADEWQAYPIEQMTRMQAMTVKIPSNWKGLIDNFSEVYHFATVHAGFLGYIEDDFRQLGCEIYDGGHSLVVTKSGNPSERHLGASKEPIDKILTAELEAWGIDPADFADNPRATRAALQEAKRRLGPERGCSHYQDMNDSQLTDTHHFVVFPNFAAGLLPDGVLFHRLRPHADDPNISYYDIHYYGLCQDTFSNITTSDDADLKVGDDVPVEYVEFGEKSLGELMDGDVNTMETQQMGWRSRGYRGGVLADQEYRLAFLHHMIDRYMSGSQADDAATDASK